MGGCRIAPLIVVGNVNGEFAQLAAAERQAAYGFRVIATDMAVTKATSVAAAADLNSCMALVDPGSPELF